MGLGGQRHLIALPREREPAPIVQEAGWAPGPVWAGAEKLAPPALEFPERRIRSESV
jgi:hypothetical protein